MTRTLIRCAWLPLVAMTLPAAPFSISTGVAAWQVTQTAGASNNGAALNTTTNAVVLTGTLPFAANMPGFEAYAWANAPAGSAWIGQMVTDGNYAPAGSCNSAAPTTTCGAEAGNYTYTLSFAAGLGGSFSIDAFTGDNGVRSLIVMQGGNTLYSCGTSGPGALCAPTQTTTAATGLITYGAGSAVTITAIVENFQVNSRNPSGFLASGSGNSIDATATPEPSTFALLGLSGLALLGKRLRRKM